MCQSNPCTELGLDSQSWSRHALLSAPQWIRDELPMFATAVRAAATGDIPQARILLESVRSEALLEWFLVHGARAGARRRDALAITVVPTREGRNLVQPSARMQLELLERDHYRCRYCSLGLIPGAVLSNFGFALGDERFRTRYEYHKPGRTLKHGVCVTFPATFDHVIPASHGGATDATNLVSACWACNFGKRRWTLAELGLEDPRLRDPAPADGWDGLAAVAPTLRLIANRARALAIRNAENGQTPS